MGKRYVFMLSLCRQTDGQWTTLKQYAPDLRYGDIKIQRIKCGFNPGPLDYNQTINH